MLNRFLPRCVSEREKKVEKKPKLHSTLLSLCCLMTLLERTRNKRVPSWCAAAGGRGVLRFGQCEGVCLADVAWDEALQRNDVI